MLAIDHVTLILSTGRSYTSVARSIPFLHALDEAADGAESIFVRIGFGHRPDVASSKADVLLALGQQGARLFELLATPSVRREFVDADREDAAESVQAHACAVFAQAHDDLQRFVTGLAGYAMAKIQYPFLSLEAQSSTALPPQLLAQHLRALAWMPGAAVEGELCRGPLVEPDHMGWFRWRQETLGQLRGFMGPESIRLLQQ